MLLHEISYLVNFYAHLKKIEIFFECLKKLNVRDNHALLKILPGNATFLGHSTTLVSLAQV